MRVFLHLPVTRVFQKVLYFQKISAFCLLSDINFFYPIRTVILPFVVQFVAILDLSPQNEPRQIVVLDVLTLIILSLVASEKTGCCL